MNTIKLQNAEIQLQSRGLTLYAVLETRKQLINGYHPIKLRITYNRKYRDYGTKQKSNTKEWEKITAAKPRGIAADKKIQILAMLQRAYDIIKEIENFTFNAFNDAYLNKKNNDKYNVYNLYDDKIKWLYADDKINTANTYIYSMKALKRYSKKNVLKLDDITLPFLKGFAKMLHNPTTIGIYFRALRHILNTNRANISFYPFGKGDKLYEIPKGDNVKKALSIKEISKIYNYEPLPREKYYIDMWLFSYFANGMNMIDICKLKYSDIKGGSLEFTRTKTKDTARKTNVIEVILIDELKACLY